MLKEYIYSTDLFQLRKICNQTYYNIGNAKNKIKYVIYKIVKKDPMKNLKITFIHSFIHVGEGGHTCQGVCVEVNQQLVGVSSLLYQVRLESIKLRSAGLTESTFSHCAISPGEEKLWRVNTGIETQNQLRKTPTT